MPVNYHIDHVRRLVTARASGGVSFWEFIEYQSAVWSRPEVAGYGELVDLTAVEHVVEPSVDKMKELAGLSAAMDVRKPSKLAIIADKDLIFGMARQYATYRSMEPEGMKEVGVFRATEEAYVFLGLAGRVDTG